MRLLVAIFCLAVLLVGPPASADEDSDLPPCDTSSVTLSFYDCQYTAEQLLAQFQAVAGTDVQYRVDPMCVEMQEQPVCVNQVKCSAPPDTFKFHVFRREGAGPWDDVGTVCLGHGQADSLQVITIERIVHEFRTIDWGQAELLIQPPDGKTLVNLKTNFFTTTTGPRIQPVTIFGHTVDIEAKPSEYVWRFGDGLTQSGANPGAEYTDEDHSLPVNHVYMNAGVEMSPSLDVTYSGRWRIDGGDWHDIDETLTVTGNPVTLTVLSATPHLVG